MGGGGGGGGPISASGFRPWGTESTSRFCPGQSGPGTKSAPTLAGPHFLSRCGILCTCTVGAVAHIRAVQNLSRSKVGRRSDRPPIRCQIRFLKFFYFDRYIQHIHKWNGMKNLK